METNVSTSKNEEMYAEKGCEIVLLQMFQESILPNFFLRKMKIFCFMLLSLSVCSMKKYCLYFEMAKLKSKNRKKQRNQNLVGLTPDLLIVEI
jgi:hypothetical protein